MLNKSVVVGLNKIKPRSIYEAKKLLNLLQSTTVYIIRKVLCNLAYSHLNVYFNYDYSLNVSENEFDLYNIDVTEYSSITYILERNIETQIEEFNIYSKQKRNLCLNFNVVIMNGSNFIISSEILERK